MKNSARAPMAKMVGNNPITRILEMRNRATKMIAV
jgi:hypothetical protein